MVEVINPQWHIDVSKLETSHLVNRIAWAKKQIIDTWQIHGDEPKYGAGGYTDMVINMENDEIEEHIKVMEAELESRTPKVKSIGEE